MQATPSKTGTEDDRAGRDAEAQRDPTSPPETPDSEADKLGDLMIAMDVVDTLRHDKLLIERELNNAARRGELIDRLREIYSSQGIDVPDHILEEGVASLEQDRFTYSPPPPHHLTTRLAKLYVTRWSWGRYVIGGLVAIVALWGSYYLAIERPRAQNEARIARQLNLELPRDMQTLSAAILSEASDRAVGQSALALAQTGKNAIAARDIDAAENARNKLKQILDNLRSTFNIRIVNREGELSGLWRVPKQNPDAYNFYLVVEAIGSDGQRVKRSILNEETNEREMVTTWAQRVPRDVLVRVQADKSDDGIIQKQIVGEKQRGALEPKWLIPIDGGAITKWN